MATKTYLEKLKDPRWQKKRLEILERDEWTCRSCGNKKKTLHVHHQKYSRYPWSINSDFLITYCEDCHNLIENSIKYGKGDFVLKMIKLKETEKGTLYTSYGYNPGEGPVVSLHLKKTGESKIEFIFSITEASLEKISSEMNHVKRLINE